MVPRKGSLTEEHHREAIHVRPTWQTNDAVTEQQVMTGALFGFLIFYPGYTSSGQVALTFRLGLSIRQNYAKPINGDNLVITVP